MLPPLSPLDSRPHAGRLLVSALLSLSIHALGLQWLSGAVTPAAIPPVLTELMVSIDIRQPDAAAPDKLPPPPAVAQRAMPQPKPWRATSASNVTLAEPAPTAVADAPLATSAPAAATPEAAPTSTPPLFHADYLHNPPPPYPMTARRHGMQGRVLLRAEIQADGSCSQTVLQQSSGWPLLDQAAMQAVRNWRFTPAHLGSQAIVAWVEVPITFKLEN